MKGGDAGQRRRVAARWREIAVTAAVAVRGGGHCLRTAYGHRVAVEQKQRNVYNFN